MLEAHDGKPDFFFLNQGQQCNQAYQKHDGSKTNQDMIQNYRKVIKPDINILTHQIKQGLNFQA